MCVCVCVCVCVYAQVESFGMHFNASGLLFNGMRVEAIGSRLADNISIDLLTRVLVDLQVLSLAFRL